MDGCVHHKIGKKNCGPGVNVFYFIFKIKKNKNKNLKPHMCRGKAPWLLGQGQQLPWLLWAVH